MKMFKKKENTIKIIITDQDSKGLWKIKTEGEPDIVEVCDALLAAYCGAVKIMVQEGKMPADLIKGITLDELDKSIYAR